MNLKNYTSEVSAYASISMIEKCLVTAGATNISKQYDDGICTAVTFRMMIGTRPLFFQLPAKASACFDVMWKEVKKPHKDTKRRIMEQSERTAWKIVRDWVEVQLAMIQLEQAEPLQVFLPYVYDPAKNETFYDKLKGSGFKQLTYGQ